MGLGGPFRGTAWPPLQYHTTTHTNPSFHIIIDYAYCLAGGHHTPPLLGMSAIYRSHLSTTLALNLFFSSSFVTPAPTGHGGRRVARVYLAEVGSANLALLRRPPRGSSLRIFFGLNNYALSPPFHHSAPPEIQHLIRDHKGDLQVPFIGRTDTDLMGCQPADFQPTASG